MLYVVLDWHSVLSPLVRFGRTQSDFPNSFCCFPWSSWGKKQPSLFWICSTPILAQGRPKMAQSGPKCPKMGKNRFDCYSWPKWLVQRGSWLDLALGHPTQPFWTNVLWIFDPNFGPGVPKNCPKWIKMAKTQFKCYGRPKLLVQHDSWLDLALGHPTQPIWTNLDIWAKKWPKKVKKCQWESKAGGDYSSIKYHECQSSMC